MGVNLAGVEVILKLLDDMEDSRRDMERQFQLYVQEAERRISQFMANSNIPLRKDEKLLPVPNFDFGERSDL
jgi:MerR family transcriptional regulator/heat shock protein HspR